MTAPQCRVSIGKKASRKQKNCPQVFLPQRKISLNCSIFKVPRNKLERTKVLCVKNNLYKLLSNNIIPLAEKVVNDIIKNLQFYIYFWLTSETKVYKTFVQLYSYAPLKSTLLCP